MRRERGHVWTWGAEWGKHLTLVETSAETSAWHGIVNLREKAGTEQNDSLTETRRHGVKTENKKQVTPF